MSKIIRPKQGGIAKIEITVDASGQADISAVDLRTGGPINPWDAVMYLLQVATVLLGVCVQQQKRKVDVRITHEDGGAGNGTDKETSH